MSFTRVCYPCRIIFLSLILVCSLRFVVAVSQGDFKLCRKVYLPQDIIKPENCTIACSPKFLNFDISTGIEEFVVCRENTSLYLPCLSHSDCRQYHAAATCKKIPCLCEGPLGNRIVYVLDPKIHMQIPNIDVCTVTDKWLNPDLPLVPFPWKTLLVVFAIVATFAICLIAVRWLSPFIRAMQAKTTARNHQNRRSDAERTNFLPAIPLTELPHVRPCTRYVEHRMFGPSGSRISALSIDKPPPYEVAMQGPPTYEEVEQEPLNPDRRNMENNDDTEPNVSRPTRSSLTHATSAASITTI